MRLWNFANSIGAASSREHLSEVDLKALKRDGAEFIKLDNGYRVWTKRIGNGPIKILTSDMRSWVLISTKTHF